MSRRTIADQLAHHEIECIICNMLKPREGARQFHAGLVCTDCQSGVAKRVAASEPKQQPRKKS